MAPNYSDERRSFLKTVMLFGGAAAGASLTRGALASDRPALMLPEKSGKGYRETEHISKYYQTARI
ncbi:MAG TPA: formate dehydrogenase [Desulfobacteraceae bacterium]|nr:formate dehydrogenase [Desulfobacteraceae bacterium]